MTPAVKRPRRSNAGRIVDRLRRVDTGNRRGLYRNRGRISTGLSAAHFMFTALGPLHQVISIRLGAPDQRGQYRIDLRPEDEDRAEIIEEQQR